MNITEKTVLDLIGRALFGADVKLPENIDFKLLYDEANIQTVLPLVYSAMTVEERSLFSVDEKKKWDNLLFSMIMFNEQLWFEQEQVINALDKNNIPCVILKGSSCAMYYPEPSLRVMGDIDILVEPEAQMDAVRVLQGELGYGEIIDKEHKRHYGISKGNVTVEVHNEPGGLSSNENEEVAIRVRALLSTAVKERIRYNNIYITSDLHHALVLILHKLNHFLSGGLGLRQLCDWALFVNAKFNEELWSVLKEKLEGFGLLTFTEVITRVCIDYLSLPENKAPWAVCDPEFSKEVMEMILSEGNFGKKDKERYGQRYFTDVNSKNRISSFFKVLGAACKHHWRACEKYPVLMPIAPFVIYAKYLKLRAQGKRHKLRPINLYKRAGTRQKLYRELKPFVTEEKSEK